MYYHGLKLHALAFRRIDKLPFPEQLQITPAYFNDLSVFKETWSNITDRCFFGDKIYYNKEFFTNLEIQKNSVKLIFKGQTK